MKLFSASNSSASFLGKRAATLVVGGITALDLGDPDEGREPKRAALIKLFHLPLALPESCPSHIYLLPLCTVLGGEASGEHSCNFCVYSLSCHLN